MYYLLVFAFLGLHPLVASVMFLLSAFLFSAILIKSNSNRSSRHLLFCFPCFFWGGVLSPFLWGGFLDALGINPVNNDSFVFLFSTIQKLFVVSIIPALFIINMDIVKRKMMLTASSGCAVPPLRVKFSFMMRAFFLVLFVGVLGALVSLSDAVLTNLAIVFQTIGATPDRTITGVYVEPQWYEVLVRAFGWWNINISKEMPLLITVYILLFIFPLVNTLVFLLYWQNFMFTETRFSIIARSYLFVWVLGNIAFFPLTFSFLGRFVYVFGYLYGPPSPLL